MLNFTFKQNNFVFCLNILLDSILVLIGQYIIGSWVCVLVL